MITHIINQLFYFYYILIILRIFLTWIPNLQWENQPWKTIREITDIYLNLFRRIVPPFNGLDFSPIIALIILQILQQIVVFVLAKLLFI